MLNKDAKRNDISNQTVRKDLSSNFSGGPSDVKKFGKTVGQRMISNAINNRYIGPGIEVQSEDKVSVTIPRVKYMSHKQRPSSLGTVRLPTAAVSLRAYVN